MNIGKDIQRLHCLMLLPHAMRAQPSRLGDAGPKSSPYHVPGSAALPYRSATCLHSIPRLLLYDSQLRPMIQALLPDEVLTPGSFPCRVANSPTPREVTTDNDGGLITVFTRQLRDICKAEALAAVVRRTALSAGIDMAGN